MKFYKGHATIAQLQWLVWVAVFFILFVSRLAEDSVLEAAIFTLINVAFYGAVIYGNINFLYPHFYEKGHKIRYAVYALVFIIAAGLSRGYSITFLYNKYFATKPDIITTSFIINYMLTGFLTYLLSFIFRIAIA